MSNALKESTYLQARNKEAKHQGDPHRKGDPAGVQVTGDRKRGVDRSISVLLKRTQFVNMLADNQNCLKLKIIIYRLISNSQWTPKTAEVNL